MNRPQNYNTKQLKAILAYIASLEGKHTTAAEITEHFENEKLQISRTTIYRHLEKLTKNGQIRKYSVDGIHGNCFEYIGKNIACQKHLHLKCEGCGELLHLQCSTSNEFKIHIFSSHDFEIDTVKTVLYGKCRDCSNDA